MAEALTKPTVIHIHIPKSAGTTINALLGDAIKGEHFAYSLPGNAEALRAMSQAARDRIDFLFGHFPYGLHTLFTRPVQYVASVREPAQRTFSFYRFVLSQEDHPLHNVLNECTHNFASFLRLAADNPNVRGEIDNIQVRMLAGKMPLREEYDDVAYLALSNIRAGNFFVCDIDRLNELLAFLEQRMGLRFGGVPRLNASREGDSFTEEMERLEPAERGILDHFGKWDTVIHDSVVRSVAKPPPLSADVPTQPTAAPAETASADDLVPALVRAFYRVLLLREPDAVGLDSRIEQIRGGRPIEDVMRNILRSPEFAEKYRHFSETYVPTATGAAQR